jgi:LacI family transcriptional regulator
MPHSKGKTTIYDVAARAGVAISTVSRVLNNSNDVSDATRDRVLLAISELQFRPHRTAKILAQKQSEELVIAMPSFTTPFHNSILKGVRSRIREQEYDLILFDLGSETPKAKLLDFLRRGAVDGLLVALHIDDELIKELQSLHAPVVIIGSHCEEFDCYYWDDKTGARKAVEHLVNQGHRRIGLITSPFDADAILASRHQGYYDALEKAGITPREEWVQTGATEKHAGISEESGYEAMEALLSQESPVTGVFVVSDAQATGALYAIRRAGLRVPEDVAIVGYDDIKTSRYIGLSSVDQKMQDVGHQATDVLIQRLKGTKNDPPAERLIIPELRIRNSSLHDRKGKS